MSVEKKSPVRASPPSASPSADRLVSLDTYRGLIMLTLAGNGFGLAAVAKNFPDHPWWEALAFHFDHPVWNSQAGVVGCSYWDLIQPSFMFMVGVAMPFSYDRRTERGESLWRQTSHALVRSLVLILMGVFLSSAWSKQTNWTFVNVLTQIGLGYMFVFALLRLSFKKQVAAGLAILVGYWLWFVVACPLPDAVTFADCFGKNTNAASEFDKWLLNLFPRSSTYIENDGGYATLNFVPSIVTMLMGAMSGQLIRSQRPPATKATMLAVSGLICLGAGVLAGFALCPIVKRIWTPSWTLFSGAYTLWILAGLYFVTDVRGYRRWTFPLVVLGTNSMLLYLMSQMLKGWTANQLKIHFGASIFGSDYGPIIQAMSVVFVFWLVCLWLYRQRVFLRI